MDLKKPLTLAAGEQADVALILEGTYPYIQGGVSSWIHQIINGLPNLTFALIFLGDRKENYSEMKFELPSNVVHLSSYFIIVLFCLFNLREI